jgi:hypothetical protein
MSKPSYQELLTRAARLGAEAVEFQRGNEWLYKLDERIAEVLWELAETVDQDLFEYRRAAINHPEDLPEISVRLADELKFYRDLVSQLTGVAL